MLSPYHADIFQNGDLKYFQMATTPRTLGLDGLPYPRVRGYPRIFFIKMTAKDVKEITYMPGPFVLRLQSGRNRYGGGNHPFRKMGVKVEKRPE